MLSLKYIIKLYYYIIILLNYFVIIEFAFSRDQICRKDTNIKKDIHRK